MSDDIYADILKREGFVKIGELNYRLLVSVWWHALVKVQLIVLRVGSKVLLKGNKPYYLKSITEQGESWARDIGPLHDYLEGHFQEVHVSFSHHRDITEKLASTHIRRKLAAETPSIQPPTSERLAQLQNQLTEQQRRLQGVENMVELNAGVSDLVQSYLRGQARQQRRSVEELKDKAAREQEQLSLF